MANNKFKGGMPQGANMNNLLKQAQKMQQQAMQAQQELEESVFEVTSGGGMVKIEINGKKEILSLVIEPEIVDKDDVEMLQDMLVAAFNAAVEEVNKASAEKFKFAQGLGGGMGMF
jgi:DNA-binding YbaB/EbfC family protein